jgi:hypothetical protein
MLRILSAFLLSAFLVCAGQAAANTLPDSCGDDKVKFDVSTQEGQPLPPAPPEGKAQIILIQTENQMVTLAGDATIRFGMDGSWVGANYGNSYFALTVEPGVHHLCASWQSVWGRLKKNVDLALFTAEPDQTYYFAAQVTVTSRENVTFALSQLNEDEGKYRLKLSKLSASNSKDARRRGTSADTQSASSPPQ